MYHLKINVMDAINFVRQKRPIVNPNYGFVCQLYNLENIILNLDNTNYQTQNKTEEEPAAAPPLPLMRPGVLAPWLRA